MLTASDWVQIVLGLAVILLGLERLRRLRRKGQLSLTDRALVTAMIFVGIVPIGFSTGSITRPYWNIGLAVWHACVPILIGALEVIVLTLRSEHVSRRAVRRVMLTAGLASAILLATWLPGFAFVGPIQRVTRPWNLAAGIHLLVFHGYVVWGLAEFVVLALRRIPRDLKRRPAHAIALCLAGAGCAGFAWMNIMIIWHSFTGTDESAISAVVALNVVFLGLIVFGCAMLAVGERVTDELTARWRLRGLQQLWERLIDLSPYDLRLASHLPAPAQLQRAYVEILDALGTLRIDTASELTVQETADHLRSGAVTDDELAPTVSQALPPRSSRQEDLALIHALASAYRREEPLLPRIRKVLKLSGGSITSQGT